MKKLVFTAAILLAVAFGADAQKAKKVKLEQTPGAFTTTELTLKAGKPYVFEVSNNGVDHEVGFVVAPSDKTDQANHIKNAYVTKMIKDGESSQSKEVVLEAGEYVYFCPMNPTPQYKIVVKE
ncbi:MAG: cupredoxin domain-containing protein [Bacteroidota bacterium]